MNARLVWVGVLTGASTLFSLALECATPLAAVAAVGALSLPRRDAFLAGGLVWLANQVVGYGLLGYPATWSSFAWGGVLGVSALAAVGAAILAAAVVDRLGKAAVAIAALLFGFAVQQTVVYAATAFLPSGTEGFTPRVIGLIFLTNALAFAVLLALQLVGARLGWTTMFAPRRRAALAD
jgi:hypothetical protein